MRDREFWTEHIRKREERGISRKAYSAEIGVSIWQWYYWERKLKPKAIVPVSTLAPQRFVRVRLQREATRSPGCELWYPSGVRIRLNDLPPPSWVRQVV
jgi:hypothetical protein